MLAAGDGSAAAVVAVAASASVAAAAPLSAGAAALAVGAVEEGPASASASVAAADEPAPIVASMHRAISPIMRVATSCMIPRPICATRPVIMMSLETLTFEPSAPRSVISIVILACALPWPRCSAPFACSTARRAASSCSAIATDPL